MSQKPTQRNNKRSVAHKQPHLTQNNHSVKKYQGPIPPPEVIQELDALVPGTAAQLIKLIVDESEHRRTLESKAMDANIISQQQQLELNLRQSRAVFRSDVIGQISGLIVCILSIVAAVFLGLEHHEGLALAIAAIPTAAIIKAFTIKK